MERLIKYIEKLENESFVGWSDEAIKGYKTACISIKYKARESMADGGYIKPEEVLPDNTQTDNLKEERLSSTDKINKIFTRGISVYGEFNASYVFQNNDEVKKWIDIELPKLQQQHGLLSLFYRDLDGLKIGDHCHVFGEGEEVFVILSLCEYSPNRYGFGLNSGVFEEVYKCYKVK